MSANEHPCPAGDRCALNRGAVHCKHCGRNWPPDETWNRTDVRDAVRLRVQRLAQERDRARWIAKHLFQMVPREVWRAAGADDGQGHYEGDHHAAELAEEIRGWEDT